MNYHGEHFDVESAKVWDLPDRPPPVGVAASGRQSCQIAEEHPDALIAVEPRAELLTMFDEFGGAGKPRIGQVPVCYDLDREAAQKRAHEQFRWFAVGWKVNSELPGPTSFDAASQFVRPEDVSAQIADTPAAVATTSVGQCHGGPAQPCDFLRPGCCCRQRHLEIN